MTVPPYGISMHQPAYSTDADSRFADIRSDEQSGNYARALKTARTLYAESLRAGSAKEIATLLETIARLEEAHLKFGFSRLLFNETYQPRATLINLLEIVGMDPLSKSDASIMKINEWAQKNLLRQGERWEQQTERFEALKPTLFPLLKEAGFVNLALPQFKEYHGAIVHGALFPTVRLRMNALVEQWKQGVRFSDLYFFSGERPLEPSSENSATFTQDEASPLKIKSGWSAPAELPKTECEMVQLVWDQSDIPEEMRQLVKVHFINAPMKKDPKSEKLLRPTTDDTVEAWLKTSPPEGRYLVVSNAPYTNRQDLVTRRIASNGFGFDTIGPAAGDQVKMAIFLDELARLIFQTKQLNPQS